MHLLCVKLTGVCFLYTMSVCGTGVHFASKYRSSTNQGIDLYLNFQSLPTPLSWTSLSRHLPRQMCSQGFIIISKLPHCPHPCAEETVKDNSWMCLFSSLPSFWQFSTEVIWMGLWKYIYGLYYLFLILVIQYDFCQPDTNSSLIEGITSTRLICEHVSEGVLD